MYAEAIFPSKNFVAAGSIQIILFYLGTILLRKKYVLYVAPAIRAPEDQMNAHSKQKQAESDQESKTYGVCGGRLVNRKRTAWRSILRWDADRWRINATQRPGF